MASLLGLSFYAAAYPPQAGGELRLYYIYYYLSKYHKINLITFVSPNFENKVEIIEHAKNFTEIRIPRSEFSSRIQNILTKYSSIKEWSAIMVSLESRFNKNFKKIFKEKACESDFLIFISPFLFTLFNDIPPKKKVVYESYNLEYNLMEPYLKKSIFGRILLKYIFYIEYSLCQRSDLIFTVSEEDRLKISKFYDVISKRIILSENGVNLIDYPVPISAPRNNIENPILLFIGSYHPPNFDAVNNIIDLANNRPDAYFLVAGSVSSFFIESLHDTVILSDNLSLNILGRSVPSRDISLNSGFYHVENWGETPTRWTKPNFIIGVGNEVNSIELELFSPHIQKIKVELGMQSIQFNLNNGWNFIKMTIEEKLGNIIKFYCEKSYSDPSRLLGLAIQSIIYSKNYIKEKFDLSTPLSDVYVFKKAKNVFLLGRVSDEVKMELYRMSDIALNPMINGSGTNIKMLDYMAAGLPVITTPIGARGLSLKNYENVIICEIPEFPAKIQELINDRDLYIKLSLLGRKTVEKKYDWEKIAGNMAKNISDLHD
jgi:glycosyltransferase involved in cell wall biosynthesis